MEIEKRTETADSAQPLLLSTDERQKLLSRHEWLTATEAAKYLKVESRTILLWARQGKITGHVLSGTRRQTWRFLHAELDAMMQPPSVALTKRRIL